MRIALLLMLVVSLVGSGSSRTVRAQQPAPAAPSVPKPGVPAVQRPMAMIVPDAEYAVSGSPDWLAMGENQVWTNSRAIDIVTRLDPDTSATVAVVAVKNPCSGLVIAEGTLWVPSCAEKTVYRIDTRTNMVVSTVPAGPAHNEGGIAYGAGSIWVPSEPERRQPGPKPPLAAGGEVTRIDPATNGIAARVPVAPGSFTAVFGYGRVWVSSTEKNLVSVIHPASNTVIAEIPVDTAPRLMAAGEGYVWTLNQGRGSVSKIDPVAMRVVATIEVGVPGGGGDIAAGEGAVWVTSREVPVSRIDAATGTVTHQFAGPGGDAIRVLHGSVWLSNGRWSNVWRFRASKLLTTVPSSWTAQAQHADLDADGTADLLIEDLAVWFPGTPTTVRMRPLRASAGPAFTLKTTLNGQAAEAPFARSGDDYVATFAGGEPRWVHYSVCSRSAGASTPVCSNPLVVASPTTPLEFARKEKAFVPAAFVAPGPPRVGTYAWNILEPTILGPDYQALIDMDGRTRPVTLTLAEDHGELKRHRWEFQHHTAFAYGLLSPDLQEEFACVYINPSTTDGVDATVRVWVTRQGAAAGLKPVLDKAVREWVAAKWPFTNVEYR